MGSRTGNPESRQFGSFSSPVKTAIASTRHCFSSFELGNRIHSKRPLKHNHISRTAFAFTHLFENGPSITPPQRQIRRNKENLFRECAAPR
jgi:hypothetical protein